MRGSLPGAPSTSFNPRPREGATGAVPGTGQPGSLGGFNPRPREGATTADAGDTASSAPVSIHAPVKGRLSGSFVISLM